MGCPCLWGPYSVSIPSIGSWWDRWEAVGNTLTSVEPVQHGYSYLACQCGICLYIDIDICCEFEDYASTYCGYQQRNLMLLQYSWTGHFLEQATLSVPHIVPATFDQYIMWEIMMCASLRTWKEQLISLFHMTGLVGLRDMAIFSNYFDISPSCNKRSTSQTLKEHYSGVPWLRIASIFLRFGLFNFCQWITLFSYMVLRMPSMGHLEAPIMRSLSLTLMISVTISEF